ncbi:MAG: D-glycerate dehydrogenase [Candidatus Brocadiia bacterium]
MKPFNVFITRLIPDPGLHLLKKDKRFKVRVNTLNHPLTHQELIRNFKGKDGVICLLSDKIDKKIINASPALKIIANYAVGYDNIDIGHATCRGILITNTPGVLTEATAELTWALILAIARRITEGERFLRAGKFTYTNWSPTLLLGTDIRDKTIGIIGAGRIGQSVARKAIGFQMKILYTGRKAKTDFEKETGARRVSLSRLLKQSDFVCLHIPGTSQTYHLIGMKELQMMKHTAFLINASRGVVIDENALVKALSNKIIAGAALDVYEKEPSVHPGLLKLNNVVLMPHLGSATVETRNKMSLIAATNLIAGLTGNRPPNLINPDIFRP